ncbi:MAG: hypothetical protein KJ893_08180, partial [Candidatus Omnitrophica bacterium]|nr:hypothetical protein [Candidatus Omnitrophota bacterium]
MAKQKKPTPEYDSQRETRVLLEQMNKSICLIAEQQGTIKQEIVGEIKSELEAVKSELDTVKMAVMENSADIKTVKMDVSKLKAGQEQLIVSQKDLRAGHEQLKSS